MAYYYCFIILKINFKIFLPSSSCQSSYSNDLRKTDFIILSYETKELHQQQRGLVLIQTFLFFESSMGKTIISHNHLHFPLQ